MFELDSPCPGCRSHKYKGDFRVQHHGSNKLLFICQTNCPDCEFNDEYTTSLE